MFSKLIILILIAKFHSILSQNEAIKCHYYNFDSKTYACKLTIHNPNGLNNFAAIDGEHDFSRYNSTVKSIVRDQIFTTPIIPSVICRQFYNLEVISFTPGRIQKLDDSSFTDCKKVTAINLQNNEIHQIGDNTFSNCQSLVEINLWENQLNQFYEKSFHGATNLKNLYIYNNPIKNFPKNIFKPLVNLVELHAYSLNLTIISSDWFGIQQKLLRLNLQNNEIYAFDEEIIDKTTVSVIDLTNNICANKIVNDTGILKDVMRSELKTCIDNYNYLSGGSTTSVFTTSATPYPEQTTTSTVTLPPGCSGGNLEERMCLVEDDFQDFRKFATAKIQDLQNQIYELMSRPNPCKR